MYCNVISYQGKGVLYRAKLRVLFLSDLGLRLLFLGAFPSLCKSAMSLTLMMLLSLRLMVFGVVVAGGGGGGGVCCEEEGELI